jgi:hypothetical protein
LLGLVASRRALLFAERILAVSACVAFTLAPIQIYNLVYPFQIQMSLVCLFALTAFFATARLMEPTTPCSYWLWTILASLAVLFATFSSANGILAAGIAAAIAWFLPIRWSGRLTITGAATLSTVLFIAGFKVHPESTSQLHPLPATPAEAFAVLRYVCALLGSVVQPEGLNAATIMGTVSLAFWAAIAVWFVTQWHRRNLDATLTALMALSTFAVTTAFLIAFARGMNGPQQALFTRYGTFSAVFCASILGFLWQAASRNGKLCLPLKLCIVLAGADIIVRSYQLPIEFYQLSVRASRMDHATLEMKVGRLDSEAVRLLFPDAEGMRPAIEFLKMHGLSFFAE